MPPLQPPDVLVYREAGLPAVAWRPVAGAAAAADDWAGEDSQGGRWRFGPTIHGAGPAGAGGIDDHAI